MYAIYSVSVMTPLGRKNGKLEITINKENIEGFLELLGQRNKLVGTVELDGSCKLSGSIITANRVFEYTADGYIDKQRVSLLLTGSKYSYNLSGNILTEE